MSKEGKNWRVNVGFVNLVYDNMGRVSLMCFDVWIDEFGYWVNSDPNLKCVWLGLGLFLFKLNLNSFSIKC